MDPITVFVGDDLPDLYFTITDDANDTPVDLSAASTVVSYKFRARYTTTVLFTETLTKTDPTNGVVRLDWPADGLDVDAGRYEAEISVSFNSLIQTVGTYYMSTDATSTSVVVPFRVRGEF